MKKYNSLFIVAVFIFLTVFVFRYYFLDNLVPFPANLLASFYQPWVSYKWEGYPNGPPGRPLGFDNLRQYYPSRKLITDEIKNLHFPLWNPYNFSGNTLLGTYQSAVFHPLSFLFFILPQIDAWSLIIILQPILTSIFTYLFLREINLDKRSSFFGAITFAFSGIMVAWWEEMFMAVYSIMFMPLILYSMEKIYKKLTAGAFIILVAGLSFSIFSGWFQGSFYVWIFAFIWAISKYLKFGKAKTKSFLFVVLGFITSLLICAIQMIPSVEAYFYSPRGTEDVKSVFQTYLVSAKHLITFIAPDFFGNPAVHNYYGGGFYFEKVIYVGIVAFVFAIFELLFMKNNNFYEKFFKISWIISLSLGFSLPTSWLILYHLKLPLISVMQPTRIFFISTFCISVISAYGLNRYLEQKGGKRIIFPLLLLFLILYESYIFSQTYKSSNALVGYYQVAVRNLVVPFGFSILTSIVLISALLIGKIRKYIFYILILIVFAGIIYFTNKYLYFSDRRFVFPKTPVISEIIKISSIDRYWGIGDGYIDRNFSTYYKIFSPDGYEPFYPKRYGELLYSSHTKGELVSKDMPRADALLMKSGSISEFKENKFRLRLMSILGVKYVIQNNNSGQNYSISLYQNEILDLLRNDFKKIWNDKNFTIYEYLKALPRFFMAGNYMIVTNDQKILDAIYSDSIDLSKTIILEEKPIDFKPNINASGMATLISYNPDEVIIKTKSSYNMLLFLSDSYYPGWIAYIDNNMGKIYRADYDFRAVVIPKGNHTVKFTYRPMSFFLGIFITFIGLLIFLFVSRTIKTSEKSE